jgi:hypothetical protein
MAGAAASVGLGCAETWPVCCPPSDSKAAKAESNRGNAGSSREPFIDDGLMQCCLTNFPMLLRALANFPRTRRDLPLSWSSRDNDSREGAPLGGSLDPRRGRGLVGIAKHAEPVEVKDRYRATEQGAILVG